MKFILVIAFLIAFSADAAVQKEGSAPTEVLDVEWSEVEEPSQDWNSMVDSDNEDVTIASDDSQHYLRQSVSSATSQTAEWKDDTVIEEDEAMMMDLCRHVFAALEIIVVTTRADGKYIVAQNPDIVITHIDILRECQTTLIDEL